MKASSFVRSFSIRLPTVIRVASSVVAPLPEQTRFSKQVSAELDALRASEYDCGSANWLVDVLDATIASQKLAYEFLTTPNSNLANIDREMIDNYLEDNVELLDACNGLVEKMGMIQKYMGLLRASVRLFDVATFTHTRDMLNECYKLNGEFKALEKRSPKLYRLMGRKATQISNGYRQGGQDFDGHEVLSGSKEVALVACHLLQRALSFKSKQGKTRKKCKLSTIWSISLNELDFVMKEKAERRKKYAPWMMNELEQMVIDAQMLHDQVKSHEQNIDVNSLRSSCEALEEGMKPLEQKVRELYRHLISIRMVLLDILSRS